MSRVSFWFWFPSSSTFFLCAKSEDADGDAVRYRFGWLRNGAAQPFAESSMEVPARLAKAGDRWRCTVVPTGVGNTDTQVMVAKAVGATGFVGTPRSRYAPPGQRCVDGPLPS